MSHLFSLKHAVKHLGSITIAAAAVFSAPAMAGNNDPIVMVHGFLGFGPNELRGTNFKYWGGTSDVLEHMRNNGTRQVFAASVGPVSSNWDRAVELYHQIKGGCVDYGATHTAKFAGWGAIRQPAGKCWATDPANNPNGYPLAMYPAWDANHPVHLVAHSQGGQTVRVLIELLENGSPTGNEGGSTLFAGGKVGWVKSASTISSPHDGTTLRNVIINYVPRVSDIVGKIVKVAGLGGSANPGFNFKLEHYGMPQGRAEHFRDFLARAKDAPFFSLNHHNSAQWDLGPEGARELNSWVKTSPNVHYFSIGNVATETGSFCCNSTDRFLAPFQSSAYQYARSDMIFIVNNTAGEWVVPSILVRGMGSSTQSAVGPMVNDSTWFPNDGVVNTRSMRGPSGQPLQPFNGTSVRGVWQYLGTYPRFDHFDVIGWDQPTSSVLPIYNDLTKVLYAL